MQPERNCKFTQRQTPIIIATLPTLRQFWQFLLQTIGTVPRCLGTSLEQTDSTGTPVVQQLAHHPSAIEAPEVVLGHQHRQHSSETPSVHQQKALKHTGANQDTAGSRRDTIDVTRTRHHRHPTWNSNEAPLASKGQHRDTNRTPLETATGTATRTAPNSKSVRHQDTSNRHSLHRQEQQLDRHRGTSNWISEQGNSNTQSEQIWDKHRNSAVMATGTSPGHTALRHGNSKTPPAGHHQQDTLGHRITTITTPADPTTQHTARTPPGHCLKKTPGHDWHSTETAPKHHRDTAGTPPMPPRHRRDLPKHHRKHAAGTRTPGLCKSTTTSTTKTQLGQYRNNWNITRTTPKHRPGNHQTTTATPSTARVPLPETMVVRTLSSE